MQNDLHVVTEMSQMVWQVVQRSLDGITDEEIEWRPVPLSNNINIIVRHLCLEAEWHLNSLKNGAPMPFEVSPEQQRQLDAAALDYHENVATLERLYAEFLAVLRAMTSEQLKERTASAYGTRAAKRGLTHMLGYHQALHVVGHCGQIGMIRNLYGRTRGKPSRVPNNPTYLDR